MAKKKIKFRNSEQAKNHRKLAEDWEKLQASYANVPKFSKLTKVQDNKLVYKLTTPAGRTNTKNIPSVVTPGGSTAPVHKVYTGDKIIGIGTLHKSNAVPIFSEQEAVEISRMRRG